MSQHGTIHWNELNTHDPDAAKAFYGASLGWRFDEMEMPDGGKYNIIMQGEQMVGGLFHMVDASFEGVPEHWFTYIAVDNLDARLKLVTDNGGTITRPAFDIPGTGRMAVLQAASGSHVAFMQPEEGA